MVKNDILHRKISNGPIGTSKIRRFVVDEGKGNIVNDYPFAGDDRQNRFHESMRNSKHGLFHLWKFQKNCSIENLLLR